MTEVLKPDICVIGGGSAGLSMAAAAAAFGVQTVLIEKGKMGGDCLNTGCVPSKALIAAAARANNWREASSFGVMADRPRVDFAAVHRHVHDVIAAIEPHDSVARFTELGVRVIQASARFANRRTVVAGGIEVKARRFVIATGSRAALPPIPGLSDVPHLTNETLFDLTVLPDHLIVIGAGPIGMELAQAFQRLGAFVTVLEAAQPLARDDAECAGVVIDALAREGVTIRSGVDIVRVAGTKGAIEVTLRTPSGEDVVRGSHLLVAAGRAPNVEDLNLPGAGVAYDRRGIRVDRSLHTTNRRIYAIGDVAGGLQFTHVANDQAGLVIRNALFRLPVNKDKRIIPWVTFTDPELAQVGLTEKEARDRGEDIRVLRWPLRENDRAQADRLTQGLIKIVVGRRGRILGTTIVGAHAGELIATWSLAIAQGLNIRALAGTVVAYPTLSEIGKRAAISFFTQSLTSPLVRRIIAMLRWLG